MKFGRFIELTGDSSHSLNQALENAIAQNHHHQIQRYEVLETFSNEQPGQDKKNYKVTIKACLAENNMY